MGEEAKPAKENMPTYEVDDPAAAWERFKNGLTTVASVSKESAARADNSDLQRSKKGDNSRDELGAK